MTTKLILYNDAQIALGERTTSLTEDVESRRILDKVWDGGAVNYCLEKGLWQHAMRAISLTYDPDTTVQFGYTYAFNKPSDFIRTAAVSANERFMPPLLDYEDRAGFWFADPDTLYFKYVSNDSAYGGDLSLWPETYSRYVSSYLAWRACTKLTQSKVDKDTLKKEMEDALSDARAKDAIASPTKIPPSGSWSGSRGGGRGDRGSRGRLIG
jgi:hypothetical protein